MTKYTTLGDIAKELEVMRADGMTHQSIAYCIDRVFGEEIEREAKTDAEIKRAFDELREYYK